MKKKYVIPRIYVVMKDYLCDTPSMGYGSDPQNAGQAAAKQNNFDETENEENEDNGLWNFKVWDEDEY